MFFTELQSLNNGYRLKALVTDRYQPQYGVKRQDKLSQSKTILNFSRHSWCRKETAGLNAKSPTRQVVAYLQKMEPELVVALRLPMDSCCYRKCLDGRLKQRRL